MLSSGPLTGPGCRLTFCCDAFDVYIDPKVWLAHIVTLLLHTHAKYRPLIRSAHPILYKLLDKLMLTQWDQSHLTDQLRRKNRLQYVNTLVCKDHTIDSHVYISPLLPVELHVFVVMLRLLVVCLLSLGENWCYAADELQRPLMANRASKYR